MTPRTLDIVGLGEPLIEFNECDDGLFALSCGGDTSNCVIAAARLGSRCGYVSRLGDDQFARLLRRQWDADSVDVTFVKTDEKAPTGIYFVTHGPGGHEFTYRREGSAASLMCPQDMPSSYIGGSRILHVSGISQAISQSASDSVLAAIESAKSSGTLVSYDTNLRLKLWPLKRAREVIHEAVRFADIARPSLEDARLLTGLQKPEDIADFYLRLGVNTVALTLGDRGALIATSERRETLPPYKIDFVDATGAGDAFSGAFLSQIVVGEDAFSAGKFANAAAALSTAKLGAVASFPGISEVHQLLMSRDH
jgi:2-dehydro-3-deoxygluconokinase